MAVHARGSIVIDGVTYLRSEGPESPIRRVDKLPHTSRAPIGEARYDVYEDGAFYAQAQWGGGVGQERLLAGDQALSGIFDGRSGKAFPARKSIGSANSSITGRLFEMGGKLYSLRTGGQIIGVSAGTTSSNSGGSTPRDQNPCVTSNRCRMYVGTNGNLYRWFETGSNSAIQDATPGGIDEVLAVQAYGRFVYAMGFQDQVTVIDRIQGYAETSAETSKNWSLTFDSRPRSNSILYAVLMSKSADPPTWILPEGWEIEKELRADEINFLFIINPYPNEERDQGKITSSEDCSAWGIYYAEYEGVEQSDPILDSAYTSAVAGSSIATGAIDASGDATIIGVVVDPADASLDTTWTGSARIDGVTVGGIKMHLEEGLSLTAEDSYESSLTGTPDYIAFAVSFRLKDTTRPAGADFGRFVMAYTDDDGDDWRYIYTAIGSGIGEVTNAFAAGGTLYLMTLNGLYEVEERELQTIVRDGGITVDVAIRGPVSSFPKSAVQVGNYMVEYEQVIFYNLGTTIRRYAPRGEDTEVWPGREWALPTGDIDCMVVGEGGIYFSVEGYLFVNTGRGTHCLAKESSANDFNSLAMYEGRLYHRRGLYLDFQYPTSRPDHYISASSLSTGKIITSALDFEKTNLWKLITVFELQYRFTNATNSGRIDLYYFSSCGNGVGDPGDSFEGSGVTWTQLGSITDTSVGFAELTRGSWDIDPAKRVRCRRMYLRIDLVPGTSGYPILEAVIAHGVTVNPTKKQLQVPMIAQVGLPDKEGNVFYDQDSDVVTAQQALLAVRNSQDLLTVEYDDGSGSSVSYDVVASLHDDALVEEVDGDGEGMTALINMAFDEVP